MFIDRHGLLDAEYEQKAKVDRRFAALLRKDRVISSIAGLFVVVVDTAGYATTQPADALKNAETLHRHAMQG